MVHRRALDDVAEQRRLGEHSFQQVRVRACALRWLRDQLFVSSHTPLGTPIIPTS